jgi:hypothetical protein
VTLGFASTIDCLTMKRWFIVALVFVTKLHSQNAEFINEDLTDERDYQAIENVPVFSRLLE